MPMIREGAVIIPKEKFIDIGDDSILKNILNLLVGETAYLTMEACIADVEYGDGLVLSVSLAPLSMILYPHENLYQRLPKEVIYIVRKPFWAKTCTVHFSIDYYEFVEDIMKEIEKHECICINSDNDILNKCDDIESQEKILCIEKFKKEENITKIIPINTSHPIVYGLLNPLEPFDNDYSNALSKYLSTPYKGFDTLAYIKTINGELKEFVSVNNRFKRVRLKYINNQDLVKSIVLQGILWIKCE
ncbi:hypothetical protein J4526_02600 [Desulfurococcaceae archaeon MEX13E-LK6-19]|nr:hypothetical protein J4526_02600 [Desulfurococcaceae archaeon MEX13E-LK6-19]